MSFFLNCPECGASFFHSFRAEGERKAIFKAHSGQPGCLVLNGVLCNSNQFLIIQSIKHGFVDLSRNTVKCRLVRFKTAMEAFTRIYAHRVLFEFGDACSNFSRFDGSCDYSETFNRSHDDSEYEFASEKTG